MSFLIFVAKDVVALAHTLTYSTQTNVVVLLDCGILIWHPLTGLKSPEYCGGSTSNPRKTPIDPVGQLQRASTSNETERIDGQSG